MPEPPEGAHPHDPRRLPPQVLRRPLHMIAAVEVAVGAIFLAVLLVLVLLQTGMRFLPVGGWVWTGELARFCLVWLTFAVSGHLMQRDEHITLELVDFIAPDHHLWMARAIANAVVAVTCVGFTLAAWAMVTSGTNQTTPAMGLALPLVYVIPLLAFVLTAFRAGLGVLYRPLPGPGEDASGESAEVVAP